MAGVEGAGAARFRAAANLVIADNRMARARAVAGAAANPVFQDPLTARVVQCAAYLALFTYVIFPQVIYPMLPNYLQGANAWRPNP